MASQIGNSSLERYVREGSVHDVDHSSQVMYHEKHAPLRNGKFLSHSTHQKTPWWLKLADGTEKQLRISEHVPMRDGHEVSLLYLGWRDSETM